MLGARGLFGVAREGFSEARGELIGELSQIDAVRGQLRGREAARLPRRVEGGEEGR